MSSGHQACQAEPNWAIPQKSSLFLGAMKKLTLLLCLCALAISLRAEYFTIRKFDADYVLEEDGDLQVTERITVEFSQERHGIFRVIPYVFKAGDGGSEVALNRKGISPYFRVWLRHVKVEGFESDVSTDGSLMTIRIGSEDILVDGVQQYVISYTLRNGVNQFADRQELYLNITGVDWQTGIDTVMAAIHFPAGFSPDPSKVITYQGVAGSREPATARVEGNVLRIGSTRPYGDHEGLTFAVAMPVDLVRTDLPWMLQLLQWLWPILAAITCVTVVLLWFFLGRDKGFTRMVAFRPPDSITPAEAGLLTDHTIQNRDIIALLFWWAQRGYIRISEGGDGPHDYHLHCIRDIGAQDRDYEQYLYLDIFGIHPVGKVIRVKDLKYKLAPAMTKCRNGINIYARQQAFYSKGTRALRALLMMLGLASLIGAVVTLLIAAVSEYFVLSGRYEIPLSLLVMGGMMWVGGNKMVKWGPGGRKYVAELWGFREFIHKAEAGRLRQLLDADPSYFGETLPFAIAFGLAEEWAAKFAGIAMSPPSWYQGRGPLDMTQFTHSVLAASTSIQSTFTATQSSSSGSSGFSGGSGGGIGGGGGGSW
jgi:uncharacterized membrane protein YgcG